MHPAKGAAFAVFVVLLKAPNGGGGVVVSRRFSGFKDLHAVLQADVVAARGSGGERVALPPLPATRLFNRLAEDYLDNKAVALAAYLRALQKIPAVRASAAWALFFDNSGGAAPS